MLRIFLIGLWIGAVGVGSTYAGVYLKRRSLSSHTDKVKEKLEVKKVRPITAPVIAGGALKGYVSAEFSFVLDNSANSQEGLDIESYFMDEAFKLIYSESTIDFDRLEKIDVDVLAKKITAKVNERVGSHAVKETLLKNLAFIAKEDMPH